MPTATPQFCQKLSKTGKLRRSYIQLFATNGMMKTEYKFSGTTTFDEYLEGHTLLAAKRRLWIRSTVFIYGTGCVVCGAVFNQLFLVIAGGVLLLYSTVISPAQFRYRVRRIWKKYPKIQEEFDITVREDGVQILDDKGNPSHNDWNNYIRFKETKSLFLLYLSPLLPLCLPKRLIQETELDDFKRLVLQSLDKKQGKPEHSG